MTAILVLTVLVLLGIAASRWGVDSRDPEFSLGSLVHPTHRRRRA